MSFDHLATESKYNKQLIISILSVHLIIIILTIIMITENINVPIRCLTANDGSTFSNYAATIISVFQFGRTFPPSHRGRRRCPRAADCSWSCSSVLGRVEGRGSRTAECSMSLHRFSPRETQPVTEVRQS